MMQSNFGLSGSVLGSFAITSGSMTALGQKRTFMSALRLKADIRRRQ